MDDKGPQVPPFYQFSMKGFVFLAVVCLGVLFVGSLSAVRSYREFADTDRVETAQPIACWTSEQELARAARPLRTCVVNRARVCGRGPDEGDRTRAP
jgi:hypothetical protein